MVEELREFEHHWKCDSTNRGIQWGTQSKIAGARAGSRTLNLGIKRLRARSVRACQRMSGSARSARTYDAAVSASITESQGAST